jgi:hypothetical protein
MAGGGLKGGLTYGETDEIGWNIVRDPVHINDLHATLLHLFGLRPPPFNPPLSGKGFPTHGCGG